MPRIEINKNTERYLLIMFTAYAGNFERVYEPNRDCVIKFAGATGAELREYPWDSSYAQLIYDDDDLHRIIQLSADGKNFHFIAHATRVSAEMRYGIRGRAHLMPIRTDDGAPIEPRYEEFAGLLERSYRDAMALRPEDVTELIGSR